MRTFVVLAILTLMSATSMASDNAQDLPFSIEGEQIRQLQNWELDALLSYNKEDSMKEKIRSLDLSETDLHIILDNGERCRVDFYNVLSRVLYKDVVLMEKAKEETIPLFDMDCGQRESTFTRREHYVQELSQLGNNTVVHALTTYQLQ